MQNKLNQMTNQIDASFESVFDTGDRYFEENNFDSALVYFEKMLFNPEFFDNIYYENGWFRYRYWINSWAGAALCRMKINDPKGVASLIAGIDTTKSYNIILNQRLIEPLRQYMEKKESNTLTLQDTFIIIGYPGPFIVTINGFARVERHDVCQPKPIYIPALKYPKNAKKINEEGIVIIAILIDSDGNVEETLILVSSGSQFLDEAAIYHTTQCKFSPFTINNKAYKTWVARPVLFSLL